MDRRKFIGGTTALLVTSAAGATHADARTARVRPSDAGWPATREWDKLQRQVGGRLAPVTVPEEATKDHYSNPFFIRDQAALTQSSGWIDAWRSQPSRYVVRAGSADDVAAAIRFAYKHRLRVAVKGGGHSYIGGSNASDSLLIWTRDLDAIELHDRFVPKGSHAAAVPAVSVGAGCIWLHVYDAVTTHGGRYVQGGGCTTVGVAGLIQGGGFGSFSKTFGLAASGLLEAEIVTADGRIRVANAEQEPELFWALKGGGGGTFGVVTRLTLRTHELPTTLGAVLWSVRAHSDDAFLRLVTRFVDHYADALFGPVWGEQVRMRGDNRMDVQMLFTGLDEAGARTAWKPLEAFIEDNPGDYSVVQPLTVLAVPAQHFWDPNAIRSNLPGIATFDQRPGSNPRDFWWNGNTEEAGTFWRGFQSRWIPATLLMRERRASLSAAWFEASRHWSVTLHFNKGLAGAPPEVIAAARDTAMNPEVTAACALAIIAEDGPGTYGGAGIDVAEGRRDAARINQAAAVLARCAPRAGCYISECDFHVTGWQNAFWGPNWPRLSRAKERYDPEGLFFVHHGVGSERWSTDGFIPVDWASAEAGQT